jgi:hypothetical protein
MIRDVIGISLLLTCAAAGWIPFEIVPLESAPVVTPPPMPAVLENENGDWLIGASPYMTGIAQC